MDGWSRRGPVAFPGFVRDEVSLTLNPCIAYSYTALAARPARGVYELRTKLPVAADRGWMAQRRTPRRRWLPG